MNQARPLQMLGDTFQHFDKVDNRMRPMQVCIEYVGRMPEGGIAPGENLYALTEADLRKRHEYTLEGLTKPFVLEDIRTQTELRAELEALRICDFIARAIRQVIARESYAPKCDRIAEGQILVSVQYADKPGDGETPNEPSHTSVIAGSDAW